MQSLKEQVKQLANILSGKESSKSSNYNDDGSDICSDFEDDAGEEEDDDDEFSGFPPKLGDTKFKYAKALRQCIKKLLAPDATVPTIEKEYGLTYIVCAGFELIKGSFIISGLKTLFEKVGVEEAKFKPILKLFMGAFDVLSAQLQGGRFSYGGPSVEEMQKSAGIFIDALQSLVGGNESIKKILNLMKELFDIIIYMGNSRKIKQKKLKDFIIKLGRSLIELFVNPEQQKLIFSVLSMVSGFSVEKFDPTKDEQFDITPVMRIERFS
jgi:hypothetical protein